MANVSINELTKAIQNSGLPIGDPIAMRQALPNVKARLTNQAQNDPRVGQAQGNYQSALQKLADADQRLGKLYSDPTSQLYMENPLDRERAMTSPRNTSARVADLEADKIDQIRREIEDEVDAGVDLYKQLVSTYEAANKVSTKSSTSKTSTKQTEAQKQAKSLGLTLAEQAGIENPRAREIFLNAPSAFQKSFLRIILDTGRIPSGGFTEKQIRQAIEEWNKDFKYSAKNNAESLEIIAAPPPKPLKGRDYIQTNLG